MTIANEVAKKTAALKAELRKLVTADVKRTLEMPLESILKTARIHVELYAHGKAGYQSYLKDNDVRTWSEEDAKRLRTIGNSKSLFEPELKGFLPASLNLLRFLANLPAHFLIEAAEAGQLHSGVSQKDCERLSKMYHNNFGRFDADYEVPIKKLMTVNPPNLQAKWKEEMISFFREGIASEQEYEEAIGIVAKLIGDDPTEHRTVDQAINRFKDLAEWAENKHERHKALVAQVKAIEEKTTRTKKAPAKSPVSTTAKPRSRV